MKKAMFLIVFWSAMCYSFSVQAHPTPPTKTFKITQASTLFNQNVIEKDLGRSLNLKEKLSLAILKKSLKKSARKNRLYELKPTSDCAEILLESGDLLKVKLQTLTSTEVTYLHCDRPNAKTKTIPLEQVAQIRSTQGFLVYERQVGEVTDLEQARINAKTDNYAILSVVFSVFLFPLGFLFGIVSLRRLKKHPEKYKGKALAIVGTVISGLIIAFYAIIIGVFFANIL